MKVKVKVGTILCVGMILAIAAVSIAATASGSKPNRKQGTGQAGTWYFALSGDSRDCGDLIVPKIAESVRHGKDPVSFYWHLGDFRRMFSMDCDVIKRQFPSYDCKSRPAGVLAPDAFTSYVGMAWDDFIERQLKPFGDLPVFLGIGNHELLSKKTRDDYRQKFQPWLTTKSIEDQRRADSSAGITSSEGDTYYHFFKDGVDFIALDNADRESFSPAQVLWMLQVLDRDNNDFAVKTIIVGMHEALPFSKSSNHAMDISCQGICTGQQVYDLLYRSYSMHGKHVYVFASHSHYFQEDIYNTPEHKGRVLPGWIVGTAGAEQYQQTIMYGYLL
ncbi:MAG: hypothetical protein ACREDR_44485, partial [Blastocatellia bacterium]